MLLLIDRGFDGGDFLPAAAAIRLKPLLQPVSAEVLGLALLGRIDDPATAR